MAPTSLPVEVLTDTFGRRHTYLRISLTERCNLRCRYCMPAEGVALTPNARLLTLEEIERIAALFVRAGVAKIRLTGGEPLLRTGVEDLAERLGRLPGLQTLALTTNGLLLPKKLPRLHAAGLRLLNISLDTLRPDRFEAVTRRRGFERVMAAVEMAVAYGYDPVKVNCVVMRGVNDDELAGFAAWTEAEPIEVRFIEYMPFGGNGWDEARFMPYTAMIERIEARHGRLERLTEAPNDTSRAYRVPGFRGRLGFITSMAAPFCASCNRLRLTADGSLKVCLFGNTEVSLRDALRAGASDVQLAQTIQAAVLRKKAAHAGMSTLARQENRPMILIGG